MQKLIFNSLAFMALVVMWVGFKHLVNLETYNSSDMVLALVILATLLNWIGNPNGKDNQEKPSV